VSSLQETRLQAQPHFDKAVIVWKAADVVKASVIFRSDCYVTIS